MKIHKKNAVSLNIADKKIKNEMFDYISTDIKFIHVKRLNMYGNKFSDLGQII